jgi:hypothetical protein
MSFEDRDRGTTTNFSSPKNNPFTGNETLTMGLVEHINIFDS